MSSILAAHALNTAKSMMPAHPLSLTKQQSQCIALDPSVTNSYIYIDAPGNKTPEERGIKLWTERWRDIFLFFFFGFVGSISNQSPHPPAPLSCSLQLQIALPPLPPAVCPAKSAHDVSLSQLWVEIHRINRFVRETHAWDCLHAVRLVHLVVRPILPQATKKGKKKKKKKKKPTTSASVYSRCTQSPHSYRKIRRPTCAYANDIMSSINFTKAQIYPRRYLCYHLYLPVYSSTFASHLPSSFPYLSVLYFISRAGQQDLDGRLFPCNYCPVNRSEG